MPKSRMRRASITIWRGILSSNAIELPVIQRKTGGERCDALPHGRDRRFVRGSATHVVEHFGDQSADLAHLGLTESAGGNCRRSEPDATGVHRRVGVKRDGVFVDGD